MFWAEVGNDAEATSEDRWSICSCGWTCPSPRGLGSAPEIKQQLWCAWMHESVYDVRGRNSHPLSTTNPVMLEIVVMEKDWEKDAFILFHVAAILTDWMEGKMDKWMDGKQLPSLVVLSLFCSCCSAIDCGGQADAQIKRAQWKIMSVKRSTDVWMWLAVMCTVGIYHVLVVSRWQIENAERERIWIKVNACACISIFRLLILFSKTHSSNTVVNLLFKFCF